MVTRAQLRELGLSDSAISEWCADGWLHRRHRAVFAAGHEALSREGVWLAGVFACGPGAVLSHRSAAELWGFWPRHWPRTEVTTTTNRRAKPGIDLHRTRRLGRNDITARKGIPTTTPDRTLTDLAEVTTSNDFRRALRQAQALSLIAHDRDPVQIHGRKQSAKLRAGPDRTRSTLERRFLKLCEQHGIPRPEVNVKLGELEVDFLWRDHNLVVEVDGWQYHRGREAFEDDRSRDQWLVAKGFRVIRFADAQLERDPRGVARTVRLASRA